MNQLTTGQDRKEEPQTTARAINLLYPLLYCNVIKKILYFLNNGRKKKNLLELRFQRRCVSRTIWSSSLLFKGSYKLLNSLQF